MDQRPNANPSSRQCAMPRWLQNRVANINAARLSIPRCVSQGFTVIELVLTLAIIGALGLLASASYNSYIERTRVYKAAVDIGSLQMDIKQYEVDNRVLPDDLAAIGRATKLDPWGRPYVYVNLQGKKGHGSARKDHKLNPLNSDYDLYSLGKDGVSKPQITQKESLDDVIRAHDGAFIGLASNF
jgi:general secretion pathway protein G